MLRREGDMPEGDTINRVTTIVSAYLRHHTVSAEQLPALINSVHAAFEVLGKPSQPEPAVPIRRSVRPDAVTCLECGWSGSMLRRHLMTAHQMTPQDYRGRWGLGPDHPLTAPNYAKRRSQMAKGIGLGRRRIK
jgi:predicted transcriptional regulator